MKHYLHIVCQSMSFLLPLSKVDHILVKDTVLQEKTVYSLSQLLCLKQRKEDYIILFVDSPIALYTEEVKDVCIVKDRDIMALRHPILLRSVPFVQAVAMMPDTIAYVLDIQKLLEVRGLERKEKT